MEAPDAATAQRVALWAEQARRDILARWFSGVDRRWPRRVKIVVHAEHPGYFATEFADGVVTITLWAGDAHLESTVRHEVTHGVLHLGYATAHIPRWIDEGIAVCNESATEQKRLVAPLLQRERRYSVRQLAGMKEYPRDVLLFYAESYSLVDFLARHHGERMVIRFLEACLRASGLSPEAGQESALRSVLGYDSFEDLERRWQDDLRRSLESGQLPSRKSCELIPLCASRVAA